MRLTVELQADEMSALSVLAQRERRDPRSQAAMAIRAELQRRGLLTDVASPAPWRGAPVTEGCHKPRGEVRA